MRHQSRHLGIAEGRKRADRTSDTERQDHAGSGQPRADPGQGIDPGSDNGADPHRHQVRPRQRRLQLMLAVAGCGRGDRLTAGDETHDGGP